MSPLAEPVRRSVLLAAGAAVAGALFSGGLLRKGVVMGPDSWAYWEGSVSLIETGRYSYFGGETVTSFPPLFSWVLAQFQSVLGVSAGTLAIAVMTLVAAASFAWTMLYAVLTGSRSRLGLTDVAVAVYVSATLAVYAQMLLSETLWHALLPILLVLVLVPAPPGGSRVWEYSRPFAVSAILALLLLCRNATVALVPGLFLMLVRFGAGGIAVRALVAVLVVAGGLAPWYWIRRSLSQLGNHPVGTSHSGVWQNATEMVGGVAYALGPSRGQVGTVLLCGLGAVLVWDLVDRTRRPPEIRPRHPALLECAVLGLLGLVGIFSITHVGEPIAGRFVVFAVLMLALAVFAASRTRPPGALRIAGAVVGTLLTAVALYRVGVKYRLAGLEQEATPLNVWISSSYSSGPPRPSGDQVLVAPPSYPWMRRGGKQ